MLQEVRFARKILKYFNAPVGGLLTCVWPFQNDPYRHCIPPICKIPHLALSVIARRLGIYLREKCSGFWEVILKSDGRGDSEVFKLSSEEVH